MAFQDGDHVTGPRIITAATEAEMKQVLAEIRDGTFAREWTDEYHGRPTRYDEYKKQDSEHLLETTGKQLRKLMSWVDEEA
ncbi:hypothetical protein GCM10010207_83400 [Streptomyces atratus]|nr:hypothetical protein GCM10010207_83400 [Streptomyces atratus]